MRILSLTLTAALCAVAAQAQAAVPLDPFRPAGASSRVSLDPFRIAQAQPAPAPAPAAAPAPPGPKACRVDEDCPTENICQDRTCQAIQVTTNILYLYYREGSFREVLGLYWAKRGPTGYTVVVPVWWHYWSPQSQSRVVAPFFWRFEDYARRSVLTVIVPGLPVSWSHEPGARSFGIWPLFYVSTKFGWAAPLFGTFKASDPEAGRSFGAVAFLYWWRRNNDGHGFDLGFPLFVSFRSRDHSFTYALPLNFAWRNHDDRRILAIPLFYSHTHKQGSSVYTPLGYYEEDKDSRSGSELWLYWFGESDHGRAGYNVLFPVAWDFRGRDRRSTVIFPLIWHFRRADSTTTVAGLWVHLRRGRWRFDTVFPVWWSASDDDGGFRALLPLFFWNTSARGRKLTWVSPIGGYSRDDQAGSRTLLLLPFFFYRRDPERDLRVFSPLYVRHESLQSYSTTRLLALLLYLREDPQGSTSALLPLFWRFRDAPTGATATVLLPFFGHRAGPRDETTFVGLGLWAYWRRFTGGGWSAGLFPLAYFGSTPDRGHAVVFPLFWHLRGARSATTVVAPFYYWHRDPHGYAGGVPALLTFFGNSDGESYAIQFPLFWRFASARQGWSTTATPVGYVHSDRDGWSVGAPILPIFFLRSGTDRSHAVLFPLFWHFRDRAEQRSTTVVGLYMHRTWGDETTDALFPLLHYRRGTRPGGSPETSFTLFPLVHYRRDAQTSVLVTPVAASARGPHRQAGFVGPYFWYRDRELAVSFVPLLHTDVRRPATGEHTQQWGPWFQIDAPGRKSRVLFPFFGQYTDQRERDTYVFPTYFRQRRSDGGEIDTFLPLFWRSSRAGRTTLVVGPYYDHTGPNLRNTGFVPFWFHARNDRRTITVIPPLLFVRTHAWDGGDDRLRVWWAIFWHSRDKDGSSTAVFPLYWAAAREGRSRQVLFPLLWRFTNEQQHTAQTWLLPFYWSSWGTGHTRALLPLAWYSSDPAQDAGSAGVMPLFYTSHGRDRFTLLTLLAGYQRQPMSRLWYVLPALFSDKVESRFGMVAPFWFSHTNKVTETNTTVVPPLLYVSRQSPERGLTTFLALFWRQHDIGSSTTLGLPLYYDVHDYHLSRTTLLLPFFVRHQRDSDQNVYWVAPLFYRHSSPTDVTMIGFPFLWDFKRGDDRTTVVFPFYAHWRRQGYASSYIFPTIYYRHGLTPQGEPDGTWRYVVAPFYDAAVKRPGDFMWEVLGGLFGHERIGRNRYLKVFFFRFETAPAPRAQTAWYSKPAPVSRRAAPRGLSMNRW